MERVPILVWRGADRPASVEEVVVRDPQATVSELSEAIGLGPGWLSIDGRPAPLMASLVDSGVLRGSLVAAPPGVAGHSPPCEGGRRLQIEGGLDAGRWFALQPGALTLGRDPHHAVSLAKDPMVSRDHCRLDVAQDGSLTVSDLGSGNGTLVNSRPIAGPTVVGPDSTLQVGSTVLRVATGAEPRAPVTRDGFGLRFRRPPRQFEWADPLAVPYPELPEPREPKPVLSVAAFLSPLVFAAAMVFIFGSLRFALFGLLSPVAAVGTYLEGRRRYRKARRGGGRATRAALVGLADALESQRVAVEARLADVAAGPAVLYPRAAAPSRRLWERRPGHPDFLELRLASGSVPFVARMEQARRPPAPAVDEVVSQATRRGLPAVTVNVAGRWTGLCGDRPATLAVARSLVLQAATTSGPTDVTIAIDADDDRVDEWQWLRWLPHVGDLDGAPVARPRVLGAGRQAAPGPVVLVVVDRAGGPAPELAERAGVGALVLAPDVDRLPEACQLAVVVDQHGATTVDALSSWGRVSGLLATGVAADTADEWARRLARLEDTDTTGARLPATVDGGDLWLVDRPAGALMWRIGQGSKGIVELDLGRVGPHVIIAGVARSGRTEALRGLICSLAAYDTTEVAVAVLDLGSGGLGAVAALPHLAGVLGDIGTVQAVDGPLARLEAEILRRDRIVRAAGCETLDAHRATGASPLPDLIVAIDDPGTLGADRAAALEAVVRLAAANAHLGIHVALATTQPAGRAASIVAGGAVRVALRLADAAAQAFVGVSGPATVSSSRPGRGWLVIGERTEPIQLASSALPGRHRDLSLELLATPSPRPDADASPGLPTVLDEVIARARGRHLTPVSPLWGEIAEADGVGVAARLPVLLGLDDLAAYVPAVAWAPRPTEQFLRVPIGVDERGGAVELDLKEAAFDGMGPHGLIVGATGSGKSELLRTLVTALAVTHGPEEMSLVLVDFKGGATFAGFSDLPHLAGMITNLESDLSGVDRMEAALLGEQQRRQELLRAAGNFGSAHDYRLERRSRPEMAAMPELIVIVDEFAELLEQRPEFVNMFGSIGRLGRSLGIHLLLATQRLDEGRLRGLESHLRYRVCLRTNSTAESRTVLGVPDAATLPSEPGIGYLKVDSTRLRRFRAALVSAPRDASGQTGDMAVLTAAMRGAAPLTHQVWLPVLPGALALGELLGPRQVVAGRGLQATSGLWMSRQRVPLGVIDRPREQSRSLLIGDFVAATGNAAVIGSPRSGKSTFLRTVAAALALTNTAEEIQLYGLDFGGGLLGGIAGLPHVGAVAHQSDPELVARILVEVTSLLRHRQRLFTERGVDSPEAFRSRRAGGDLADERHGDVYLLIDGWGALRATSDEVEVRVTELAAHGLGHGIHVVLTANRWSELRASLRDALIGRLELRLTDPFESALDRRAAENVPAGSPGRGITENGRHFLAACPTLNPIGDGEVPPDAWTHLVAEVSQAWTGPRAPRVQRLPLTVRAPDVPAVTVGLPFGVAEPDLAGAAIDPSADQHVLVLGDGLSGKSTFLRTLLAALAARHSPAEARVLVIDPRRGLLEVVPEALLFAYVGGGGAAAAEIARLRAALEERLPGPELTPEQLRDRSWWSGPEAFVVVDDHDLVVTQTSNPLLPLVDLLAQAPDIGLHLVLARRVAGWQRAQFEPVVQRLRETSATTLLFSGDPAEGIIGAGQRAIPRPPGRAALLRYREDPVLVQVALPDDRISGHG